MPATRVRPAALLLMLATVPLQAQDSSAVGALAGTWVGEAVHQGQRSPVALTFASGRNGALDVLLSLPAVHVREVPVGTVRRTGGAVQAGPFALTWDSAAGTLSGTLPPAIVPVHAIAFTLRRGAMPPFPPRPDTAVPAPAPAWTFDAGAPAWGDLASAGSLVLVGADDGRLHAIDARRGEPRWTFQAGGAIRARPTPHADAVYVHADDGVLTRLDAASGAVRWQVRIAQPAARVPPPGAGSRWDTRGSAVTASDQRLLVGTHDGQVLALDPEDGRLLWRAGTGASVLAAPSVSRGRAFAGSYDGKIYAFDAATGALLWSFDTGAPVTSTPVCVGDVVVAGSRSYDLFGLDAATGAVRWNRYVWFSWIESTPLVLDGVVYVGSSDAAKIMAIEAATGHAVWDSDVLGASWGTPAVDGGLLYVGTRGQAGAFTHAPAAMALERTTGRMVWRVPVTAADGAAFSGFAGSPVVAGGVAVFAAVDGRVYAFELPPAAR